MQETSMVDGVRNHARAIGEGPAVFEHQPMHHRDGDHVLKPFQRAQGQRTVRGSRD